MGDRQAGQRPEAGGPDPRRPARRTASRPRRPPGREGFIHPHELEGDAGRAELRLIVRDFDDELLEQHVALLRRTAEEVVGGRAARAAGGRGAATSTRTCAATSRRFPDVVAAADEAIRAEGLEPVRDADPRRHRRLAAERDGPADAEPLHRRPRVPLRARVGLRAGHGLRRGDGRARWPRPGLSARPPGRRSGSRTSSTPRSSASARSPARGSRRPPRAPSR